MSAILIHSSMRRILEGTDPKNKEEKEQTQMARKRINRPKGQEREGTDPKGMEQTQRARKRRNRPKGHGRDPKGKKEKEQTQRRRRRRNRPKGQERE